MTDTATRPPAARLPMDPRIRQRRLEVRRDEGRRRLRILVMVAVVVATVAAGYGITRSPVLDVDHVDVQGSTNTPVPAVLHAAGLDHHRQMADVDAPALATQVRRLPWVATARVSRHWPATVRIILTERTPLVAMPAGNGQWAAVDATGRVLALAPSAPTGLIVVTPAAPVGPPGTTTPAAARAALRVVEALPSSLEGRVVAVTVAADGSLTLGLTGGAAVAFGSPASIAPKLVALATLLARVDTKGVATIDVRVPTAPVLTRR